MLVYLPPHPHAFDSLYFVGFSVGDELGLAESLGNVEANKRRALNIRTGANNIGVLPASKMPVSVSGGGWAFTE